MTEIADVGVLLQPARFRYEYARTSTVSAHVMT